MTDSTTTPEFKLSRRQRRELQQLADRIHRTTEADRLFFERFPHRRHRVRLAGQAEIEQFGILAGAEDTSPPAGFEHYIAVKNFAPGIRLRKPLTSLAGIDTDVDEAEARWVYETTLSPQTREIEATLRKAVEARA